MYARRYIDLRKANDKAKENKEKKNLKFEPYFKGKNNRKVT